MAAIAANLKKAYQGANSVIWCQWSALGNADTGDFIACTDWADRSVQVEGTFGGATVTIQGSNDGANWETLNNASGTALTFTAAGLKQVLETTGFIRAITTGGAGTSITVTLVGRMLSPKAWS